MKFISLPQILLLLMLFSFTALSQPIIINELYNSSGTDEWVELLVVEDSLDLRGWDIRDFNTTGGAQTPLNFSMNSLWQLLRKGTIIVVATPTVSVTEDTDPSDYLLIIKSNNSLYFSGTVFSLAGSSDAVQIRDASDVHIFGVSWGTGNAGSLPSPKVHFSGSSTSNTSISFNEDSIPELTSTANWTFNDPTPTIGNGNTATNSAWITQLRLRADGSGSASISPDTIHHGNSYTFNIKYLRDTLFTVTDLRIVFPYVFQWSHDTGDVSFTNMTSDKSVSGDTIYFNNITWIADSTIITIQNVTAPDSTAYYQIIVQTKAQTRYENIAPLPRVVAFGLPVIISEIKDNDANGIPVKIGQLVTIRGIVTVANQFGGPSYIQDHSAGIAIYGSSFSNNVSIGDEVIVSGKVDPFNGLSELTSPYLHSILSTGNIVTPLVVNCAQIANDGIGGIEQYEGLLVRINAVRVRDANYNPIPTWSVTGSGTNYNLLDATDTIQIRVDNNVNFANTPAPQSYFNVIGVVGQYKTSLPYIGGYQLMPRQSDDILSAGPIITSLAIESDISSTSFKVNWATQYNGTTRARYGTTPALELGVVAPDNIERTNHQIEFTGLQPATIYYVEPFSVGNGDTSIANRLIVSTSSPAGSTGQINVYFNKSVNTTVALGEFALGNQDLVFRLLTRINNARRSIDAALYSLSGSDQGDIIAGALVAAKNRGVKVRVICEYDSRNQSGFQILSSNGVPMIHDRFDQVWDGYGLMHNKFFIFDYRGGAPESVWVWTGSWNPTYLGTVSDRQNALEIQDVALAGAYTMEFNEMWGSSTDIPNQSASRFGGRKLDNTPHTFYINNNIIKAHFSPSDKTTSRIGSTLAGAEQSNSVALLTFTRKDLADTLIQKKNAGKKVRVIMDNNTDDNNQFSYLQSNGVDVRLKGGSGLLHHKYAIVDAIQIGGSQKVITGSHNWSNSAENSNDENTLIIHSTRVANLYLQEFTARYYEAGGTDSIIMPSMPYLQVTPSTLSFDSVLIYYTKRDSLTVQNIGNVSLVVSSIISTNNSFSVEPTGLTIPAFSSQKLYVDFSPNDTGRINGKIIFTHNGVTSPDTILVDGFGIGTFEPVDVDISYNQRWNLISLPVMVGNSDISTLFPYAIPPAYEYTGTYEPQTNLENRKGYWLKFQSAGIATVNGFPILNDTIYVVPGWNLIGSITLPININSITQVPTNNIISDYFGYENGYVIKNTLIPGKGYWIKVKNAGKLILGTSNNK